VDRGKNAGAATANKRHGFGETVDGVAPRLPKQKKDGGDQCAGVADTDPPDEVDDGEAPADGDVDAPDAVPLRKRYPRAKSIIMVTMKPAAKPTNHPLDAGRVSTIALILSVTVAKVWPGSMTGAFFSITIDWSMICHSKVGSAFTARLSLPLRTFPDWVANLGQDRWFSAWY
jgi:hypothetical protein